METSYSNIGFLSENFIKELERYKDKQKTNPLGINGGYQIIKRFDRILSESQTLHLDKPDEKDYIRLIIDEMRDRKITTITIKTAKVTLEKMLKNMEITEDEFRIGKDLFTEISAKCKEYTTKISCH
jgi:hypothetical protein